MSAFKFACPVCGQHITADTANSGSQIECPTCFRKIIIPQGPATGETKLILSATELGAPRPTSAGGVGAPGAATPKRGHRALGLVVAVAGLFCVAGALFIWQDQIFFFRGSQERPVVTAHTNHVGTNILWTLNTAKAVFPENAPAGRIRGEPFEAERVVMVEGLLVMREGEGWPPSLAVTVQFYSHAPEELSEKQIVVGPQRSPPLPRVVLHWKDERGEPKSRSYTQGYMMVAMFGKPAEGRMPGSIYIALPDAEQSCVAGAFEAEIRKVPRGKRPPPKKEPLPDEQT